MSEVRNDGIPILLAFVTGAVVGVGLGLLLAPRPGKETRVQLADFARRAREKAEGLASSLRRETRAEGTGPDA